VSRITTDKQRQALETKGWRLIDAEQSPARELWFDVAKEGPSGENTTVNVWSDGEFHVEGFVNRHRLAEFLSIINAKDDVTAIEGEVMVAYARDGYTMIGEIDLTAMLEKIDGKRVRVTIEPLDDAKGDNA
jgi:hypothetical protein